MAAEWFKIHVLYSPLTCVWSKSVSRGWMCDFSSWWEYVPGLEMLGVAYGKVPLHCLKVNQFSAAIRVED